MSDKDYYSILGIPREATEKEIKAAYRKLARKHHPDVNQGDKTAEATFKKINEAYEVLSDKDKRQKYDQYGDQWQHAEQFARARQQQAHQWEFQQGSASQDFDSDSVFEQLLRDFGARGSRGRQRARRGSDIDYPVEITLEEAYSGSTRILGQESAEVCHGCHGTGTIADLPCSLCRGAGKIPNVKRIEVKIPAGVDNGSRVRIAGKGEAGYGGAPSGDLYLVITVKANPIFERQGENVQTTINVPLMTAVLGGEIPVPTLKGKVMLTIPAETQNNRIFNLSGKGMPSLGNSTYGNLLVKVNVVLPTNLSAEEKALFEQLSQLRKN